ncbi:MAG TPA: enediyne biosynthesis protein UnbU [Blastocatellia bacterium]|nr:enediyne biosynthesis protein UnbU [Blastocatellia bacterium]
MIANQWNDAIRLGGLRRFAIAISILNILGHTVLGFEQSWAQPLVALATAYSLELLLEVLNCWSHGRKPAFTGGLRSFIDFLLPAHISGLAVGMLVYANDRLWVVAFAVSVAITSKVLFRAPVGGKYRHFYNPSNFGITVTLLLFTWVSISPPYHFTENLDRIGDWLLPGIIVFTGSFLNARFTRRLPLILAWLIGFVAQAAIRSVIFETPLIAGLLPMTGLPFVLYSFYMVTDPATTPFRTRGQIAFGAGVAAVYGVLLIGHVVFGLFFSLTIVCTLRAIHLYAVAWATSRSRIKQTTVHSPTVVTEV